MVCKAFSNKFLLWKSRYLNIMFSERYSLRHSCMCHLIDTKEIWCQSWYIQNIWKIAISRSTIPCPSEMMVESYPMWMGMDLSVSKDEKESLSAIMWFKAPESIKIALDFEVLSMRAWPFSCCGSPSCWSLLWNISGILMWFLSRREVASSSFFSCRHVQGGSPSCSMNTWLFPFHDALFLCSSLI